MEAWDRFNDLLRGCPHHGFSELHQLDTFYNALNSVDQDSLNSAAGDVQPPVVQIQSRNPNPEPNVAPVVAPVVTLVPKASIPFPSRRNDERRKEKS
ncbi:hypothetical protein Tco_0329377 [Tanacetum coccineum]|uniref:Reverse transcriptase domain-containing protein n=1 Tax=Tanacetum coccineum TaxID=301880 RepID=A0ABQ5BLR9_9ASTR